MENTKSKTGEDWMKIMENFSPMEMWQKGMNTFNNSTEIMENTLKFHKACVAYHQAIHDMTEAINENNKLMNGK